MNAQRDSRNADELLGELESRPAHHEREARWAGEAAQARGLYSQAAEELLNELTDAGSTVETIGELRTNGDSRAVPVLLRWLPRVTYLPLKKDIISAFTGRWGKPASIEVLRGLLDEFHRADVKTDPLDGVRWSIGDALERLADDRIADQLVEIAQESRHGAHRGLVVAALGKLTKSKDRVLPVLVGLLDDDAVAGYALIALGKLGATGARDSIEPLLRHPEPWVRKQAKKALAKLS